MATAELAGVGQRSPGSPAVDVRGDAVEVWLVQIGLDELTRVVLEIEPLVEDNDYRDLSAGVTGRSEVEPG